MSTCTQCSSSAAEFETLRRRDRTGDILLSLARAAGRTRGRTAAARYLARLIKIVKSRTMPEVQQSFGRRTVQELESVLNSATPVLAGAAARAARCLYRDPQFRAQTRLLPVIVRRTLWDVARRISQGQVVLPRSAVRILARQTRACLERGCEEVHLRRFRGSDRWNEAEMEVANPAGCLQNCESKFQQCLNPPWWQFWKRPDPNQCLAERQACQRGRQPVSVKGCGEGVCEGQGCEACCQFFCPNNLSECLRLCSPYR